MSTTFGPTFAAEIAAAGLAGLPFAWTGDGEITGRERLTAEQDATLDAVIAAHDPTKPAPAPYVPPTPLDWFLRLSQETQAALDVAARTDTAVSLALRYASGVISVDVKDPRTIANVGLLFTKGLLTAAERDTLLAP